MMGNGTNIFITFVGYFMRSLKNIIRVFVLIVVFTTITSCNFRESENQSSNPILMESETPKPFSTLDDNSISTSTPSKTIQVTESSDPIESTKIATTETEEPPTLPISTEVFTQTSLGSWIVSVSYGRFPDAIDLIRVGGGPWRTIYDSYDHPQYPRWSPDGQWIAFTMFRDNGSENDICLVRPDGSDFRWLTNTAGYKGAPSWSPDGKQIIFSQTTGNYPEAEVDIFTIDVDTQLIRQVTDTPEIYEQGPVYSPDGTTIAFTAAQKNSLKRDLVLFHLYDNSSDVLTNSAGGGLSWSPDSTQIAFTSGNKCKDILIIDLESYKIRNLTDSSGSEINPVWSPDGYWIAFMVSEDCINSAVSWEIFVIHPDGIGLAQITDNQERHPVDPSWYPLPSLELGKKFIVTESGEPLNLRFLPTLDGKSLLKLEKEDEILVMEGPVEADEYLWWKVSVNDGEIEGWVAEIPGWFSVAGESK